MRWLRNRWLWAGVAIVLAVALRSLFVARLGARAPMQTAVRRELVERVVASGRVLPPSRIGIASLVTGRVASVDVREGDHVRAGQPLVRLDDAEARAALAQAKAALAQAAARVDVVRSVSARVASASVRQAEVGLKLAEATYERDKSLFDSGAISHAELDEAERALDVAKSQAESARATALGSAPSGADARVASAALAQAGASVETAEARLAESRILAPSDAVVLTRAVEPGDVVQPARTLLVLAKDGETLLVVQPDEKNLSRLARGQRALASSEAFPEERFGAEITYIAPSVDPQRGTIEVRLKVPEPPPHLRPDMTVSVDVEVGRRQGALALPTEAIRDLTTERPWILVADESVARRRDVKLGVRGDGAVEIAKGLSDGELVLVGADGVMPGQRVRRGEPAR